MLDSARRATNMFIFTRRTCAFCGMLRVAFDAQVLEILKTFTKRNIKIIRYSSDLFHLPKQTVSTLCSNLLG